MIRPGKEKRMQPEANVPASRSPSPASWIARPTNRSSGIVPIALREHSALATKTLTRAGLRRVRAAIAGVACPEAAASEVVVAAGDNPTLVEFSPWSELPSNCRPARELASLTRLLESIQNYGSARF